MDAHIGGKFESICDGINLVGNREGAKTTIVEFVRRTSGSDVAGEKPDLSTNFVVGRGTSAAIGKVLVTFLSGGEIRLELFLRETEGFES